MAHPVRSQCDTPEAQCCNAEVPPHTRPHNQHPAAWNQTPPQPPSCGLPPLAGPPSPWQDPVSAFPPWQDPPPPPLLPQLTRS